MTSSTKWESWSILWVQLQFFKFKNLRVSCILSPRITRKFKAKYFTILFLTFQSIFEWVNFLRIFKKILCFWFCHLFRRLHLHTMVFNLTLDWLFDFWNEIIEFSIKFRFFYATWISSKTTFASLILESNFYFFHFIFLSFDW